MRILLIEDDAILGEAIQERVAADNHAVDWMHSLEDAETSVLCISYDLILLDLMLSDGQGLDFLRHQRQTGIKTPVIILTALDRISDRIAGLNAGADDYLVKPFDLSELSARIAAVARRYTGNPNPLLTLGPFTIDMQARTICCNNHNIDLTAREWAILEALLKRPGAVLSRAQLEDKLYAFGTEIESNAVEVHISRLRKKLGRKSIHTVRGVGYRLKQS